MSGRKLTVVDLTPYIEDPESFSAKRECERLVEALLNDSAVCLRDPRVSPEENDLYLDMLERYFAQPWEAKAPDMRPEQFYQVGISPAYLEKTVPSTDIATRFLDLDNWPHEPSLDYRGEAKERFFWRLADAHEETLHPELYADQVIPTAFRGEWEYRMNRWGMLMLSAIETAVEMMTTGLRSIGYNIGPEVITDMMQGAPHLLAPNGTDLERHQSIGEIYNGFHTDLNALTIHGRSRFPALRMWKRSGEAFVPSIPDGCLLMQVGQQLEWLTGGFFRAGFHEVVCLPETIEAMRVAKQSGQKVIRVSSTVFGHFVPDQELAVHPAFLEGCSYRHHAAILRRYPPVTVGFQVKRELEKLGFKAT